MSSRVAFLCLIFFATQAAATSKNKTVITNLSKNQIIADGNLEEWNIGIDGISAETIVSQFSGHCEEGQITSDKDLSAKVYTAFDTTTFHLAALVTDDVVIDTFRGGDIWQGDMFEVLLKTKSSYLHIGVAPNGDAHVFFPSGSQNSVLRAAAQKSAAGYRVEIDVPFKALGYLAAPQELAVNFALKDKDLAAKPLTHLSWAGYRHNATGTFGSAILTERRNQNSLFQCVRPSHTTVVNVPLSVSGQKLMAGQTPVVLHMMNFQSASANWVPFWTTRWNESQILKDLALAKKTGSNSIRIFVFFEEFGGANVKPEMLDRLTFVVDKAARLGLLSVVSFFPFKKEFRKERWSEMETHLVKIVAAFRGSRAIAMWDLMNEPDHSWALQGAQFTAKDVKLWSEHMFKAVKEADPTHLITVGLAGHFAVRERAELETESLAFVDVVSVHGYFGNDKLKEQLRKSHDVTNKPVILQEYGVTGLYFDENDAAEQYKTACDVSRWAQKNASLVGFGAWELFDHPTFSIQHKSADAQESDENHFGLFRVDGTAKKSASVFCNCLERPTQFSVTSAPASSPK